jgi:hypothetical protein
MLVPSGAVCSRDPKCGGIIQWYDRKGIEAAWKQKKLEQLIAKVPRALPIENKMASYTIEGQAGEWNLETVLQPTYLESKNFDAGKLQAYGLTLAARQGKKDSFALCYFAPKNREPVADLWDGPTKPATPTVTPPSAYDPNLAKAALPRVSRQALKVLELLKLGPATNRELLSVAIRYGSRIHDLRKAGYRIEIIAKDEASGLTTYKLFGGGND